MNNNQPNSSPGPVPSPGPAGNRPASEPTKRSNIVNLVFVLAVVLVVVGLFWVINLGESDSPASGAESGQDSATPDQPGQAAPGPADANQNPGSDADDQSEINPALTSGQYVDYESQPQLDGLAGTDRWLNFHADWCPYCVHLNTDINGNLGQIPAAVTIVKIDFDKNQDLRVRYGVTRQTTIVRVDADGNEIDRFVGYGQLSSLSNLAAAFGY